MSKDSHASDERTDRPIPDTHLDLLSIDFGAIFASADIGITLTATGSGRIHFANAHFCEMTGYSSDELSGGKLSFVELTAPEDLAVNVRVYKRFVVHEIGRFTIIKRYVRKNGTTCRARVTAVHIAPGANGEGRTLGIIEEIVEEALPQNAMLRLIDDYIAEHVGEPVTTGQLAALAGLSARSLSRHFSLLRRCSPSQYIRKVRLERARTLLQDGTAGRSVTGVALACGFSNTGHFAKEYREAFGELPSVSLLRHRFRRPL